MVDVLEESLPVFSGRDSRVRCFAHTTNLVAKRILKVFDAKSVEQSAQEHELFGVAQAIEDDLPDLLPGDDDDEDADDDASNGGGGDWVNEDGDEPNADVDDTAAVTAAWTAQHVSEVRCALGKVRTFPLHPTPPASGVPSSWSLHCGLTAWLSTLLSCGRSRLVSIVRNPRATLTRSAAVLDAGQRVWKQVQTREEEE